MRKFWASALALFTIAFANPARAQDQGETLFNQVCVACHTIGGGRLVGPDLAGVHVRREERWLLDFIKSAQAMVNSGDPVAETLLGDYNGIMMPNQAFSDDEIRAILGYIALKSGGAPIASAEPAAAVNIEDLIPDNVQMGQDLFVGRVRLDGGGASCISCHNVNTDDVLTGGSLAKDLTDAVSRLTRQGVDAMIANPPFAPMRVAFEGKPVTEAERVAIVDYLQFLEANQDGTEGKNFRITFLLYGLLGIVVLLGFFFVIGLRGSKHSVNHAIYERQAKSV